MLNTNPETVQFIIDKAHQFQMQQDGIDDDPDEGGDPSDAEIRTTIDDLEPDQQVELVALMWLGRGDYDIDDWDDALANAGDSWNERTAEYLIGTPLLADYLTAGLEQVMSMAADQPQEEN